MAITFDAYALRSHSIDENARRRYVVRYKCNASASEGPVAVRQAFDTTYPLGITYFTYGSDVDTSAVRIRPFSIVPWRQGGKGSGKRYWIDATFDSLGDKHCKDETFDGPPWTHPWVRSTQSTRVMKPVFDDKDGTELQNYCEEPYYPAPEIEQLDDVIVLTGNLQNVDFFKFSEYKERGGAVNQSAIGNFPARTLRVVELDWTEAFWGACQRYYQCRMGIAVNTATWDLKIKQFAFRTRTGLGNYTALDTALPQPINSSGAVITTGSAATRTHYIHKEKSFTDLGIPVVSLLT